MILLDVVVTFKYLSTSDMLSDLRIYQNIPRDLLNGLVQSTTATSQFFMLTKF